MSREKKQSCRCGRTAVIGANRLLGYAVFSKALAGKLHKSVKLIKTLRYRGYGKCPPVPAFNGKTDRQTKC